MIDWMMWRNSGELANTIEPLMPLHSNCWLPPSFDIFDFNQLWGSLRIFYQKYGLAKSIGSILSDQEFSGCYKSLQSLVPKFWASDVTALAEGSHFLKRLP